MAKRTIGKPRFYADILQYLKALGYYGGSSEGSEDIWNMNPYQSTFIPSSTYSFNINKPSTELDNLLSNITGLSSSGIYVGILNHDSDNICAFDIDGYTPVYENIINLSDVGGGAYSPAYKGYSLAKVTGFAGSGSGLSSVSFNNFNDSNLGAVSYGRWFEPSHSPDLQATITKDYEGVSSQTTIGGSTLTNINHLGVPMWGDLPAWTLEKQDGHDYKIGGTNGRRQWDIKFSYLSDDDVFNKAGNENKFFNYDSGGGGYTFDESMASFFKLTLNGSLPFIFCPNSSGSDPDNVDGEIDLEFAMCKIDNVLSFNQVAYRTWNVSMRIVEVW